MNALRFQVVPHDSPQYWQAVALRNDILRKPLGLLLDKAILAKEEADYHVVGEDAEGKVVASLTLSALDSSSIRSRQVAIQQTLQRQGIGSALMSFSEIYAAGIGYRFMILHARETAVAFYERLGYKTFGDRYLELGLPHWHMNKVIG